MTKDTITETAYNIYIYNTHVSQGDIWMQIWAEAWDSALIPGEAWELLLILNDHLYKAENIIVLWVITEDLDWSYSNTHLTRCIIVLALIDK